MKPAIPHLTLRHARSATSKLVRRVAPLALLFHVLAAGAASASTAPCTQALGSYSSSNQPPACWRAYSDTSPFNTVIPAGARTAPNSAAVVGQMARMAYHFDGTQKSFQLASTGSRPIYWSSDSDRLVTIRCTANWGPGTCQGTNGIVVDNIRIHIPVGAQPEQQWDGHMTVIDQSSGTEYDFERASWTGSSELTVAAANAMPLDGSGATGLGGQGDAANFGLLAGIIRPAELRAGSINHALAISVPCTSGYVWPAQGPWGYDCQKIGQNPGASPPLGGLLALNMTPAQIATTHAPAWEQTIMTAMARYGMYINDTNGGSDNTTLSLEQQGEESFTSFGSAPQMGQLVRQFGGTSAGPGQWIVDGVPIAISRLRLIAPCVPQGTCPAAGGPEAHIAVIHHSHHRHHKPAHKRAHRRAHERGRRHRHRTHGS